MFFREVLQIDKFDGPDFKYENIVFKLLSQKYPNKTFFVQIYPNKAFLFTNLGNFVFPPNFAVRLI